MTTELIGQQLDHYRIDRLVGSGGMGSVYQAFDLNLARPVALKVMHAQYAAQPEFQRRFQQEAQAIARLSHPSIVNIYQFGRRQGYWYIVMEYIVGLSLGAYIKQLAQRRQVVALGETLDLIAQVAEALGYAHWQGVVHRDVKPDNILIQRLERPWHPDGLPLRAVVTDFGLAKLLQGGVDTQADIMLGTLPYMSPEQVTGDSLDGRSDLYALGVVLYQLATGKLPFDIKSPTDAVIKHLNENPPEPHNLHPDFPLIVENIIMKALAKKPANRYQTGDELAVALRQASHSLASEVALPAANSDIVSIVTEVHTRYPTPPSSPSPATAAELPTMIHSRPAAPPEKTAAPAPPAHPTPHPPHFTASFSARLGSSTIRNGGACAVTVQNQGQYPVSLRLIPRTPSEVVLFDEWRKQLKIGAGQTETAVFQLTPPERPLLGKSQSHPFEIEVTGPGQRQALNGTLLVTPYAPTWLLVLLVLMTLLLVILTAVASLLL